MARRVLVLGSGVIGLTTALTLQQDGYVVDIWAKDLPPYTTSNKAAAYWYPFSVGPAHRVQPWAMQTLQYYTTVMIRDPASGVAPSRVTHLLADGRQQELKVPREQLGHFEQLSASALPAGYTSANSFDTVIINADTAMQYLVNRFMQNGGRLLRRAVTDIREAFAEFDVVVNCTGLGARELFNDKTMYAGRGQTVIIRRQPGMDPTVYSDEHGPHSIGYIVPRQHDVVLGGTFQQGNESLLVSETDTNDILRKCAGISKGALARDKMQILGEKVGLRPCRPEVRLEAERFEGGKKVVVHNYGHGGGGWSVCWGCAAEAAQLVSKHFASAKL